jgi:hypothetical protein
MNSPIWPCCKRFWRRCKTIRDCVGILWKNDGREGNWCRYHAQNRGFQAF